MTFHKHLLLPFLLITVDCVNCFIDPFITDRITKYYHQHRRHDHIIDLNVVRIIESSQLFSSRSQNDGPSTRLQKAIQFNREIINLGRKQDWERILSRFADEESKGYLSDVNYSTIFNQCARIRHFNGDDPRFNFFMKCFVDELNQKGFEWIGCRNVSSILYSISISKPLQRNKYVIQFLQNIINDKDFISLYDKTDEVQSISNTALAFARQGIRATKWFKHIENRAEWLAQSGNAQAIANTAWAFATLGIESPKLFQQIEKCAEWLVQNGNPQAVANTGWAFATLGVESVTLFRYLDARAEWLVQNSTPQGTANTAWAFATLNMESQSLFTEIEKRAEWLVQNGNTQTISNMAWAFATLGIQSPTLFSQIENKAEWLVHNGSPQAIANTAWAFAKLGIQSTTLFDCIESHAEWLVQNGTTQSISSTAWAYATLGIQSLPLFQQIETRAEWLVQNGTAQAIANTAWAFATLNIQPKILFHRIETRAEWLIQNGNTQHITNIAWAYATLGIQSPTLFRQIETRVEWLVQNGTTQAITNTAWAFATTNYNSDKLFYAISSRIDLILHDLGMDALSLLYSFVVSNQHEHFFPIFSLLWTKAYEFSEKDLVNQEDIRQLSYIYLFVKAYELDVEELNPNIFSKIKSTLSKGTISSFQRHVSACLQDIGLSHEFELSPTSDVNNGMLNIDLACRERKIAVECDGPHHYLRVLNSEEIFIENGPTQAKRRLLEKLGWRVVNIPYFQFARLNQEQQKIWLRAKVRVAGVDLANC